MKVLVTGGSGFLGGAVCRLLAARGDEVVSLARGEAPALAKLGVRHVLGDITALESLLEASKGVDAVIHVAGKAGDWGTLDDYYAANVAGTDNVIAACFMNGIGRLVFVFLDVVAGEIVERLLGPAAVGEFRDERPRQCHVRLFLARSPGRRQVEESGLGLP